MEVDLKKENSKNIFFIMAASLTASVFLQFGYKAVSNIADAAMAGGVSLMLSAVLVMLANIIPHGIKHKIVFTRVKNELPACRINKLCKSEPRVEYEALKSRWPEVFSEDKIDGSIRNSRWYQQIYKSVKDTPEVLQAHRSFLLYRDAFSGLLIIFIATLAWSAFGNAELTGKINNMVYLVQGAFLTISLITARVFGNRFVVNAVVAAL